MDFLRKFNDFQLEGRYPDYQQKLYRSYQKKNSEAILKNVNQIRLWLLKGLQ